MSNPQTIPFARALSQFTRGVFSDLSEITALSLPCSVVAVSNAMVTVKFEVTGPISLPQVTVPQAISRYARPPTQIGDKGRVTVSDVYLGGVTGLGGGVANFTRKESNLTSLVFEPLSNTDFPTIDGNAYFITGPNGAVIQDDSGVNHVTVTSSSVTLAHGSNTVVVSASGIAITGTLTINGVAFLAHEHSGVTTGGGNTGGVV